MDENPYTPPRAATDQQSPAMTSEEAALEVSIFCSTCPARIRLGDEACPGCARTISEDEKSALQGRWESADPEAARAAAQSSWGRWALGLAAAGATVRALISMVLSPDELAASALWEGLLCAALWALFIWSFRQARIALGVALAVYLVWWLAPLAWAPLTVLGGVLWKILILMALIGGFTAEASLARRRAAMAAAARASRR